LEFSEVLEAETAGRLVFPAGTWGDESLDSLPRCIRQPGT
jgi:hypothetical protein